ncbi:PLD nuclease N-terminal domain-containing protein [Aquimarina aggregata]|uniref:PLD nuclease N-terminal domain-containing protein n=1 Tax=Aquimarina aggregata TaxID=1642818 RepID=UPI002493AF03|nr:PLD nuclease N-terminal domain-containing protein [Aquimarina aggregata]
MRYHLVEYMFYIVVILFILTIIALIDILRSDFKNTNTKIIWLAVVLFFPTGGALIYFFLARKDKIEKS